MKARKRKKLRLSGNSSIGIIKRACKENSSPLQKWKQAISQQQHHKAEKAAL